MTFTQWQTLAQRVHAMTDRINVMRHERAFRMAEAAGIGADCVCIHNAAIDDKLNGWCYRSPARLKIAKRCKRILDDWSASRIAERILSRAWQRVER